MNQQHIDALNELCTAAHEHSREKGFWDAVDAESDVGPRNAAAVHTLMLIGKVGLIMSECGEMVEAVRKPALDPHCPQFSNEAIEAADVFIRLADYCKAREIDLGEAVAAKMAYNATRPSMHGKEA